MNSRELQDAAQKHLEGPFSDVREMARAILVLLPVLDAASVLYTTPRGTLAYDAASDDFWDAVHTARAQYPRRPHTET